MAAEEGNTMMDKKICTDGGADQRKLPGIMIAAVKSGSGKTTVTCALLEALKRRGLSPCAFKCGPDYIDPMLHRKVIGVPSRNLDSFFSEQEQLRRTYMENMKNTGDNGIAVVEGAMGLYDGLGGVREEGSAYDLSRILCLPVVLVVDAHGMGRSLLPLLFGFLQYDRAKRIRGVILNRTTEHFYRAVAPTIERELQIPALGFLPDQPQIFMESRYLGLKPPDKIADWQRLLCRTVDILEDKVSVDRIIEIAGKADRLRTVKRTVFYEKHPVRIGIAKDEAFCFYYEENLKILKEAGADLISFSPLRDKKLPEGIAGILLGGGYPEWYAKKLEANVSMRGAIRQAIQDGMPSVAEGGGFLYLHETLEDDKQNSCAMCGVVPGKCFYTGRLVRFGYMTVEEKRETFLKAGTRIKGHEFHYYESENPGTDCTAVKPASGKAWDCIQAEKWSFWGFPQLYYPSNPDFAVSFVRGAEEWNDWRIRRK